MIAYYRNQLLLLILGIAAVGIATYFVITLALPEPTQNLAGTIAAAAEGFVFGGIVQSILEGSRILTRTREARFEKYHAKIRELVFITWLHNDLQGYPSATTGDLHVRNLLEQQKDAEERYFKSALPHLDCYGLTKDREKLRERITQHNEKVDKFDMETRTQLGQTNESERIQLAAEMDEIWKSAQEFAQKLKGVIYDIEDHTLKGKCDFERLVEGP